MHTVHTNLVEYPSDHLTAMAIRAAAKPPAGLAKARMTPRLCFYLLAPRSGRSNDSILCSSTLIVWTCGKTRSTDCSASGL